MYSSPRRPLFYKRSTSNIYRMFLWALLIIFCLWFIFGVANGTVTQPFSPTPTATRTVASFELEGDVQFTAGKLDAAVAAYRNAVTVDPENARAWASLARIQTYSSTLRTTDAEKRQVLQDALESINRAVALAPDDSTVHAIRAFVLDWNANPNLIPSDEAERLLSQAQQEALQALQIDPTNTLALVFYAEILVDQQKWTQAEQYIEQALVRGEDMMDLHRVYAYVLETLGQYNQAIQEYDKAIELAPNLTFLYLQAGANYRTLAFRATIENQQTTLYLRSLDYFDRAANINKQLQIQDPIPYLSIAKTYSQMGEFFAAARNVQKALDFNPTSADIYGQLGVIFFKSRNYEGSIPALKCAIRGCTAPESCQARYGRECNPDYDEIGVEVVGQPLSNSTVVYYYTYGSVLAALSRPKDNKCGEALQVLSEVRAAYSTDTDIMGIVSAGEAICASLAEDALVTPAVTPTATVTPAP